MAVFSMTQVEEAAAAVLPPFLADDFAVSAFTDAVMQKLNASAGDKDKIQKEVELVLAGLPELFFTGDICYPKASFFRNTEIRIIPTRYELEKNILLPGARFAPFCSGDFFPDEYHVPGCSVRTMDLRFGDFAPVYLLLGRAGLIDYLTAEDNANWSALQSTRDPENLAMRISVFDMTDFYRDNEFQDGDAIIAKVEDWDHCVFSFTYEPQTERPAQEKKEKFLQHFEEALLEVCDWERDPVEIPDQISAAYLFAFLDDNDLRYNPAFSLDQYPSSMYEIAIQRDGAEWTFCPADAVADPGMDNGYHEEDEHEHEHEHEHHHHKDGCSCGCHHDHKDEETAKTDIKPEQFSASSGTIESLDAILAERNAPMNPVEIHSYALDSLCNGVERFDDYRTRMESLLGIKFADDAQEAAFLNYLEDDWEISQEYFNPEFEMDKNTLRTRLLDLCEQRIDLSLRLLEHFNRKVPKDYAHPIAGLHRDVTETLALLSSDAPLPEGDAREQLEYRVEDLEDAFDDLASRINEVLG